jgi:beta-lactamase superfamily II metal-dependent hydrolase
MSINIKILGVKDGDANIITLKKGTKSLVILIDSGKENYAGSVCAELDKALTTVKKDAPDLIVCTHYDNDHIGGMPEIVEYYAKKKKKPGRVWLHKPSTKATSIIATEENYTRPESEPVISPVGQVFKRELRPQGTPAADDMIFKDPARLKTVVDVVNSYGIKIEEPFAGSVSLAGWPEIEVWGPDKKYFKELFPKGIIVEEAVKEEAAFNAAFKAPPVADPKKTPCERLDQNAGSKSVTATNRASIVICITVEKKKYLFAGDADIAALKRIPGYKEKLKGVYFLKIPHHASRNNLSCELISLMSPKFAYVSGDTYIDDEVLGCLEANNAKVEITRKAGKNLVFPPEK